MHLDNFRHTNVTIGRVSQDLTLGILGRGLLASRSTRTSSIVGRTSRICGGIRLGITTLSRCRSSIRSSILGSGRRVIHGECRKCRKGILLFMVGI